MRILIFWSHSYTRTNDSVLSERRKAVKITCRNPKRWETDLTSQLKGINTWNSNDVLQAFKRFSFFFWLMNPYCCPKRQEELKPNYSFLRFDTIFRDMSVACIKSPEITQRRALNNYALGRTKCFIKIFLSNLMKSDNKITTSIH